jgi:hypothetical protein
VGRLGSAGDRRAAGHRREPLSVCQLIPELEGAVIVTTPQKVAAADVRKSINFCKELGVKVLGVIEEHERLRLPEVREVTPILRANGGRVMADEMGVPFLGSIPIDRCRGIGRRRQGLRRIGGEFSGAGAFREIVRERRSDDTVMSVRR